MSDHLKHADGSDDFSDYYANQDQDRNAADSTQVPDDPDLVDTTTTPITPIKDN